MQIQQRRAKTGQAVEMTGERRVPVIDIRDAFPTTFALGRDGRLKAVHAGFPSPGSGEYCSKAEREMTALVERLLAVPRTTSRQ